MNTHILCENPKEGKTTGRGGEKSTILKKNRIQDWSIVAINL